MAGEFSESRIGINIQEDEFIRRTTVTWQTAKGRSDGFVATKKGERDPKFGFFKSSDIKFGPGAGSVGYDMVTIVYEDLIAKELPVIRGIYNGSTVPLPLERHPDYRCIWNHHVVQDAAADPDPTLILSEWEALKDLADKGATADTDWPGSWVKSNQALSRKEEIVNNGTGKFNAIKPGVQSFVNPASEVTQIVYTRDTSDINAAVDANGKLVLPETAFRFGLTPGDDREGSPIPQSEAWLVTSTNVRRINDWYEITQQFKFAKYGWDTDIYESG